MTTQQNTRQLPPAGTASGREIAERINRILEGKVNAVGDVTLGTGTTTTIQDARIGGGSFMPLMPLSGNAASQLHAGGVYVTPAKQSAVVTHPSTSNGLQYRYAVFGG